MKTLCLWLLLPIMTAGPALASNDAVRDFLQNRKGMFPGYYATDKVLRLDLDLQGNGQVETLVTLNRDRDGDQGNVWTVYKKTSSGYQAIGTMTFSPEQFYVGKIDELNAYGLVAFGSGGGGTGSVQAYIDDGDTIREADVSGFDTVDNLSKPGKPVDKYLKDKTGKAKEGPQVIDAKKMAAVYGVHIEKESYRDALYSGFQGIPTK